jgi:signal transduction histidine kinase
MALSAGRWKNQGIRTQVLLPWVVLLCLGVVLSGFWLYMQHRLDDERHHARLHRQGALIAKSIQAAAMRRWANVLTYRVQPDPALARKVRDAEASIQQQIARLEHLFEESLHNPRFMSAGEEMVYLGNFKVGRAGLSRLEEGLLRAVDDGDAPRQTQLLDLLGTKLELNFAALDDLATYHVQAAQLSETLLAEAEEQQRTLFLMPLLGLMVAGLGLAHYQTSSIAQPLMALTAFSRRVEQGHEATFNEFAGMREIDQLSKALGSMVASLRRANEELGAKQEELRRAYAGVEAQVRERTAELETANKDLENFSYSVSHDLRAPLRAIDGFIAILTETQAERLDEEGRRHFGIVADNARKMGTLIDDILSFSRAGRLQLELIPTDMRALVEEAWAGLTQAGQTSGIEFRLNELPQATCDPRALRQVWQNLFANAIKFSRDRHPPVIEVGAEPRGQQIRFWVQDNGVGFSNDYVDKLFVLFQRLHGMDEFEGTGVGLAIVKRFVQKHGGDVFAEGVPGRGARFDFTLPAVHQET